MLLISLIMEKLTGFPLVRTNWGWVITVLVSLDLYVPVSLLRLEEPGLRRGFWNTHFYLVIRDRMTQLTSCYSIPSSLYPLIQLLLIMKFWERAGAAFLIGRYMQYGHVQFTGCNFTGCNFTV